MYSREAIRAGDLDRKIAIEALAPPVDDGMRSKPGGWFGVAERWAALTPLSGAERVAAAENAAFQTLKFRVRRDAVTRSISPKSYRLVYRDETFDVQEVQEVGKSGFDLLVTGRADGSAAAA